MSFGVKFLLVLFTILVVKVAYHMIFPATNEGGSSQSSYDAPGKNEFDAANRMIISDQQGVANGNKPDALNIAKQFSNQMAMMRSILFTGGDEKAFSLTDGNFITYCAVNGDRCVILVHVPQLRKFTADAKESMNELAWICAWQAVAESGLEIKQLAVGVKGAIQYSAVYTGRFDPMAEEVQDPLQEGKGLTDTKMLYPYFVHVRNKPKEPVVEEAAAATEDAPVQESTEPATTDSP